MLKTERITLTGGPLDGMGLMISAGQDEIVIPFDKGFAEFAGAAGWDALDKFRRYNVAAARQGKLQRAVYKRTPDGQFTFVRMVPHADT